MQFIVVVSRFREVGWWCGIGAVFGVRFDGIGVYVPVTHCFIKKKCFKLVSRISKQGIQCECDQLKIEMCAKMSRSFIAKLEDD